MGLDRWPGTGTASIGHGVPGSVTLDHNFDVVTARQHRIGGYLNGGTVKLYPSIGPSRPWGEHSNTRLDSFQAFLSSMDLGGVDSEILRAEAFESQVLTSPAVHDSLLSRRIAPMVPDNAVVAYADGRIVRTFNTADHQVVKSIDTCSPVLQVDRGGLVRTRRGLLHISLDTNATYIAEGDFVHASNLPQQLGGDRCLATSVTGAVMLFDISTGQCTWKERRPRGSVSSWSRVATGHQNSPHMALWCNRYQLASIDLREPPTSPHASPQQANVVLSFDDKLREIRDLDNGSTANGDAFLLTSSDTRWIGADPRTTLLSVEHPLAAADYTISIYASGLHHQCDTRHLLTMTSQMMPLTVASVFGKTRKMPSLLDDPYFLESWPTIIPQSHITCEREDGDIILYSVASEGGLYAQKLRRTKLGQAEDDLIDLPTPDMLALRPPVIPQPVVPEFVVPQPVMPEPMEPQMAVPHAKTQGNDDLHAAFDLLQRHSSSSIYNFEKLYELAFKPLCTDFDAPVLQSENSEVSMSHVNCENADEFLANCTRAWIAPLLNRNDPHSVVIKERKRCTNKLVQDMIQVSQKHEKTSDNWADVDFTEELDEDTRNLLQSWDPRPNLDDKLLNLPSSSQDYASQPTHLHTLASDFVSSQDMPLSQPLPTLGSSKRKSKSKHKHKERHKKHRKGHFSQP